ncbi:unnamed protein product [Amoebophrya sp. A120]|nr:unnamed protein product [Amoebophrya sp. A120]|eukprot:GSA120T00005292001.1
MPSPRSKNWDSFAVHAIQILCRMNPKVALQAASFQTQIFLQLIHCGGQPLLLPGGHDTPCMMRQCCGEARSFTVDLHNSNDSNSGPKLYSGEKQNVTFHKCIPLACLPMCRPEMIVFNKVTGKKVGSIRDPFMCCNVTETIKDADGKVLYYMEGQCLQLGFYLPCCFDIEFPIESDQTKGREGKGMFYKRAGGCMEFLCGDLASKFEVEFPPDADTDDKKALLVMSSMMIDMIYFEKQDRCKPKRNK